MPEPTLLIELNKQSFEENIKTFRMLIDKIQSINTKSQLNLGDWHTLCSHIDIFITSYYNMFAPFKEIQDSIKKELNIDIVEYGQCPQGEE